MGRAAGGRLMPVGAEPGAGGTHFRVWAPDRHALAVAVAGRPDAPLEREEGGYFAGFVAGVGPGTRYRYRLDGGDALPDPASRFQPEGPHGPSEVIDPGAFAWTDAGWRGIRLADQITLELHVGTFTPEGTWEGAARALDAVAADGFTSVELMPVADFPGAFGWGYDGVDLFAPARIYGTPDEMRAFVDRAHALGLGVILDVVYNHLGPSGMYWTRYARAYLAEKGAGEWGDTYDLAVAAVREHVRENAAYWIREFHLDGLRLDATHAIHDPSPRHIVRELTAAARDAGAGRAVVVVAENDRQAAGVFAPDGWGCDGVWNDDFHHAARVALTGERGFYFGDFAGSPQELVSAVKRGYLYQGQHHRTTGAARGEPALGAGPAVFVHYLENHDQVSASLAAARPRLLAPARYRALAALLLLAPQPPLLFQGQERGARAPFPFFADHEPELAAAVAKGRAEFLARFGGGVPAPDPSSRDTFASAVLRPGDADERVRALHRDLISLRRSGTLLAPPLDGAVLGERALCLRSLARDLLLVVNLGGALAPEAAAEPLLAPPRGGAWRPVWSSDDVRYGGTGGPASASPLAVPAEAAVLFAPSAGERAHLGRGTEDRPDEPEGDLVRDG